MKHDDFPSMGQTHDDVTRHLYGPGAMEATDPTPSFEATADAKHPRVVEAEGIIHDFVQKGLPAEETKVSEYEESMFRKYPEAHVLAQETPDSQRAPVKRIPITQIKEGMRGPGAEGAGEVFPDVTSEIKQDLITGEPVHEVKNFTGGPKSQIKSERTAWYAGHAEIPKREEARAAVKQSEGLHEQARAAYNQGESWRGEELNAAAARANAQADDAIKTAQAEAEEMQTIVKSKAMSEEAMDDIVATNQDIGNRAPKPEGLEDMKGPGAEGAKGVPVSRETTNPETGEPVVDVRNFEPGEGGENYVTDLARAQEMAGSHEAGVNSYMRNVKYPEKARAQVAGNRWAERRAAELDGLEEAAARRRETYLPSLEEDIRKSEQRGDPNKARVLEIARKLVYGDIDEHERSRLSREMRKAVVAAYGHVRAPGFAVMPVPRERSEEATGELNTDPDAIAADMLANGPQLKDEELDDDRADS